MRFKRRNQFLEEEMGGGRNNLFYSGVSPDDLESWEGGASELPASKFFNFFICTQYCLDCPPARFWGHLCSPKACTPSLAALLK